MLLQLSGVAALAQLLHKPSQGCGVVEAVGTLQLQQQLRTVLLELVFQRFQHAAASDGGQLSRIPHQQQPCGAGQGVEQGLHQLGVHHRHLIDYHHIGVDRAGLVAAKTAAGIGFQGAMQGGALHRSWQRAEGFPQPSCSLAGGCQQQGLAFKLIGEQLPNAGGFARSGAAREQQPPVLMQPLLEILQQALLLLVLPPAPEFGALRALLNQHKRQLLQGGLAGFCEFSEFGCSELQWFTALQLAEQQPLQQWLQDLRFRLHRLWGQAQQAGCTPLAATGFTHRCSAPSSSQAPSPLRVKSITASMRNGVPVPSRHCNQR